MFWSKLCKSNRNSAWNLSFISCNLSHLLYGICVNIFVMNRYISKSYTRSKNTISLRSKRFQSSYCTKVRTGAKKKKDGRGIEREGGRGNACLQTRWFWKTPLDISRFGSLENWQQVLRKDYPWITRFVKLLCSLIELVPGDCKNCNKKGLR